MENLYQKLAAKKRSCRERDVRIKLELILLSLKLGNIAEACARRGFARKFYYKWFNRLKKAGWNIDALQEKSRRPLNSPRQTRVEIEKAVHWYHDRQYGSRMIQAMLGREQIDLSKSTICHILNKRRRPRQKQKPRLNPHNRRYELVIPGQRVQLDVKYVPEFVAGVRIYNFVAVDECTRWRFARAYAALNQNSTYDFLEHLKRAFPFPIQIIQTDNGFEFTSRLNAFMEPHQMADHLMAQWCRQNNVVHRCIKPGAKELNGKVERSHRIDEQYFYWKAPTDTLDNFNGEQTLWIWFYNTHRLHGGLGFKTPKEKLFERLLALQIGPGADFSQSQGIWDQEGLERMRLQFVLEAPRRISTELSRQQGLVLLTHPRSKAAKAGFITLAPTLQKLKRAA